MKFRELLGDTDLSILPPEQRALVDGILAGQSGLLWSLPATQPGKVHMVVAEGGPDGDCAMAVFDAEQMAGFIAEATRIKGLLDAGATVSHSKPKS